MHKVKELEKRWFNYKVKKIIIPAIKISSLYLLLVGVYYVYENKSDSVMSLVPSNGMTNVLGVSIEANNSIVEKSLSLEKELIVKEEEVVKTEQIIDVPEVVEKVEKIVLSPIIPVIDMEKEERISDVKRVRSVKRVKPTKQTNMVKAKKNTYLTAKELAVVTKSQMSVAFVPRKTKKMKFTSTSTNYLETMKHKFFKSKSPRDALLIAKTYYKNGEYLKSEKWALSANKLDNSLEDSWLFFAKSKAKLGKRKEALKILVSYYKKSQSKKAKSLIRQIKNGRV